MANLVPKERVQTVVVPKEAPAIDKGLVVRSIVYLIAVANFLAPHLGLHLNLTANEDIIYNVVSELLLVGSFVHAYWKNNNITKAARIINEVSKQINVIADAEPIPVLKEQAPIVQPAPQQEAPQTTVAPVKSEAPKADNQK